MYFDALTVAAIAAELCAELLEGRVQQVLLPDRLSMTLEIYAHHRRYYLFASAHPQTARLHLMTDKPRRGSDAVSPLLLLLRKYVRGGRLADVHQPPAERILHLLFESPEGPTTLVVETIGRYSNLILVGEDGTVLDAVKRIGPGTNRYRVILPSHAYVPPPAQDKLLPDQVTEYRLRKWLAQSPPDQTVRQALVAGIAGISPLAAREIAFRALRDVDAPVASVQRIAPLLEAHHSLTAEPSRPCIVRDDDEVIAFAAYPLTHMGNWEPVDSMSAALLAYFGQESAGYQKAKAPLLEAIASARERLARRRQKLVEERDAMGNPDSLKRMGEAILAYAYQIHPGQSELVAEWMPGEPPLHVELDPELSPPDNAQVYFRRYRKAQRTAHEIPALLRQVESEQNYLDQLAQDLDIAESRPDIDAVAQALTQAGYLRPKRRPIPSLAARPLRFTSPDDFTVWVGKNVLQNERLTFHRAAPDDLWLHARGMPGAHVIIQAQGRPVPERTLEWSAGLAAYYSRGRNDTQVEVDVVPRRQVHRLKGGRPGQVTYRNQRTLSVAPRHPDD
jgi:predicted ribosome quality control (RQC) complex YloA/Tae2 family protein